MNRIHNLTPEKLAEENRDFTAAFNSGLATLLPVLKKQVLESIAKHREERQQHDNPRQA